MVAVSGERQEAVVWRGGGEWREIFVCEVTWFGARGLGWRKEGGSFGFQRLQVQAEIRWICKSQHSLLMLKSMFWEDDFIFS